MTEQVALTLDEFIEQYAGKRYEFVDGRALPMGPEELDADGEVFVPPPKLIHGLIVGQITALLTLFLQGKKLGRVLGAETGFFMQRDPVELRAADVAFVTHEQLAALSDTNVWLPTPPIFAAEIISEYDKAADTRRKVRGYMSNGTRLLWVIYPMDREVEVHVPSEATRVLGMDDTLDGGAVLPGLHIRVAEVFAVLDEIDK